MDLAVAALQELTVAHQHPLSTEQRARLLGEHADFAPYPNAAAALKRLQGAGRRLIALTNSRASFTQEHLRKVGLESDFEVVFPADQVRRYKPGAPYRMVTEFLRLSMERLWMVAAHDWDIVGAGAVGYAGAFACRSGDAWAGLQPEPS